MGKVICITGLSGSGKSTIARRLASELDAKVFSIGDFERETAKKAGYSDLLEYEKKVGMKKAYYDLLPLALEKIKKIAGGERMVVEGVYTPEFYEQIMNAFGKQNVLLVNIAASRHSRLARLALREGKNKRKIKKELRGLDKSKAACGVNKVLRESHVVIRRKAGVDEALKEIKSNLQKKGWIE